MQKMADVALISASMISLFVCLRVMKKVGSFRWKVDGGSGGGGVGGNFVLNTNTLFEIELLV